MQVISVIYLAALVFALVSAIQAPRVKYFDKFTWVLFILFIPFIGIIGWFVFGRDNSPDLGELGYDDSELDPPDGDDHHHDPDPDDDEGEGELK